MKTIGIITITKGGLKLAIKLAEKFPGSVIHAPLKFGFNGGVTISERFEDHVGLIFNKYDILIFIMAAGIVVRTIVKYLASKTTDPGILVMDEKGRFVISLLSGHIGGANEAALEIARRTGAVPVITTSSDVNELVSVDMLARDLDCMIDDMTAAKDITAMIVNGQSVALVSDHRVNFAEFFSQDADNADGIIFVTNKKVSGGNKPFVHLIPRNIIAGIGCRKGISKHDLIGFIESKLNDHNLDKRSIKRICSIDIKKDEQAVTEAAKYYNADLIFFSSDDIKAVEQRFNTSDFVREITGAGAVSEPCAYLGSSGKGSMIMQKQKKNGMTLALWEEN